MKIRPIEKKDKYQWSEMRTSLWPETTDNHLSEINDFFTGTSIDIVQVYVIEVEEQLAGFIELNIRSFAEGSRSKGVPYVEAWYVKLNYREAGLGQRLMKQAESWALSHGYKELASDTEVENHHSIKKHKQLGFVETERIVCFLKKLKD